MTTQGPAPGISSIKSHSIKPPLKVKGNKIMDFVTKMAIFGVFLVISLTSTLLIFLYIFSLPYKIVALVLARAFRPDIGAFISNESAYFRLKGNNLSILTGFWVLQGQMPLPRLTKLVAERIAETRNPEGTFVFQRLREYPSEFMGFNVWRTDKQFHVRNHVGALNQKSIKGLAPGMSFDEKLEKLTSAVASRSSWREKQSQWQMFLVRFPEEDRTVFITRTHHSLADGYSHRFIFECLFQCKFFQQPPTSPPARIWDLPLRVLLLYPWRMLWDTAETTLMLLNDPNKLWNVKDFDNVDCLSAYSKPIRKEDIKRIRRRHGVDYNTVVFSAVGRAFRRLMQETGQKLPAYSSLMYLGNKDNHPKIPTNHYYPGYVALSSTETSLDEVDRQVLDSKRSLFPVWVDIFFGKIVLSLPNPLRQKLQGALAVDTTLLVSPFISFDEVVSFDGHRILDFVVLLGYRPCRTGTEMMVMGALNQIRFQLVLSKTIAPDEASAKRLVDYAYEELHKMISRED